MVLFKFNSKLIFNPLATCYKRTFHYSNTLKQIIIEDISQKFKISPEDHIKVLNTLNETNSDDLAKYNLTKDHIKNITERKDEFGPFKSINEVLEIKGFNENLLHKICCKITGQTLPKISSQRQSKMLKSLLLPEMNMQFSSNLQSVVAIHLEPSGIAWSKLAKFNNTVLDWKCETFSSLPAKMLPSDNYYLAMQILNATPYSDAYIFEASTSLSPQNQGKQRIVSSHIQQIELQAMIFALLNTSPKHNNAKTEKDGFMENKVFYLKSKVSARLFKTLIGYEKVSAASIITGIVENDIKVINSLPCNQVQFSSNDLNNIFLNASSANKELLSQALMLGITFMDLCIHKKKSCYDAFNFNKSRDGKENNAVVTTSLC